jgi:hypothetical protein
MILKKVLLTTKRKSLLLIDYWLIYKLTELKHIDMQAPLEEAIVNNNYNCVKRVVNSGVLLSWRHVVISINMVFRKKFYEATIPINYRSMNNDYRIVNFLCHKFVKSNTMHSKYIESLYPYNNNTLLAIFSKYIIKNVFILKELIKFGCTVDIIELFITKGFPIPYDCVNISRTTSLISYFYSKGYRAVFTPNNYPKSMEVWKYIVENKLPYNHTYISGSTLSLDVFTMIVENKCYITTLSMQSICTFGKVDYAYILAIHGYKIDQMEFTLISGDPDKIEWLLEYGVKIKLHYTSNHENLIEKWTNKHESLIEKWNRKECKSQVHIATLNKCMSKYVYFQ